MGKTIKPRPAKGTRDFSPGEMELRNFIFETIRKHFKRYGFEQIETPAVENLETLTGKYGDEGDQLIFKILNSGDYLKDVPDEILSKKDSKKLVNEICEKALRYDLTVPFARYVVQHRNEINFPFRRFQMQPVWRADRPQKGRYREFYQCDADIIGSDSLLLEAELMSLIKDVFNDLKIRYVIKVNHRKLLHAFCHQNGIEDKFVAFTTALDKLDKKGWEGVRRDLLDSGIGEEVVNKVAAFINTSGAELNVENIRELSEKLKLGQLGINAWQELVQIAQFGQEMKVEAVLDLTLARGLNYYTSTIVEVLATDQEIGSICGGGRYDDLTSVFGLENVSGVGISFGIDRIFDILNTGESREIVKSRKHIVIANFGDESLFYIINAMATLRKHGLSVEIYPDPAKLQKQFKYADQRGASHVIIAGSEELSRKIFRVKDLGTGEETDLNESEMIELFSR